MNRVESCSGLGGLIWKIELLLNDGMENVGNKYLSMSWSKERIKKADNDRSMRDEGGGEERLDCDKNSSGVGGKEGEDR